MANLSAIANCRNLDSNQLFNNVAHMQMSSVDQSNHLKALAMNSHDTKINNFTPSSNFSATNNQHDQTWTPMGRRPTKIGNNQSSNSQANNSSSMDLLRSSQFRQRVLNGTTDTKAEAASVPRDLKMKGDCSKKSSAGRPKSGASSKHWKAADDSGSEGDDEDDEEENSATDEREERESNLLNANQVRTNRSKTEQDILGSDSVSLESSVLAPSEMSGSENGYENDDPQQGEQHGSGQSLAILRARANQGDQSNDNEQEDESEGPQGAGKAASDDEMAARREQEAAEASEAEAADRSALDEQQQAQREIILAQAQSEAKAIREQQQALLRQQQLQQQILLRRHQSDHEELRKNELKVNNPMGLDEQTADLGGSRSSDSRSRKILRPVESEFDDVVGGRGQRRGGSKSTDWPSAHLTDGSFVASQMGGEHSMAAIASSNRRLLKQHNDINSHRPIRSGSKFHEHRAFRQGSGQGLKSGPNMNTDVDRAEVSSHSGGMDGNYRPPSSRNHHSNRPNENQDDMSADYSTIVSDHASFTSAPWHHAGALVDIQEINYVPESMASFRLNSTLNEDDLKAAAQHYYGSHYGQLQAHHGDYYQFAESKKKGQFEAGFKRGGKHFHTSGHSSQHKNHAEGHVKWSAKKGKGSHHWELKHKNKKHYGEGSHYGGGHSYY